MTVGMLGRGSREPLAASLETHRASTGHTAAVCFCPTVLLSSLGVQRSPLHFLLATVAMSQDEEQLSLQGATLKEPPLVGVENSTGST